MGTGSCSAYSVPGARRGMETSSCSASGRSSACSARSSGQGEAVLSMEASVSLSGRMALSHAKLERRCGVPSRKCRTCTYPAEQWSIACASPGSSSGPAAPCLAAGMESTCRSGTPSALLARRTPLIASNELRLRATAALKRSMNTSESGAGEPSPSGRSTRLRRNAMDCSSSPPGATSAPTAQTAPPPPPALCCISGGSAAAANAAAHSCEARMWHVGWPPM
mmetsp:Transcript_37337/g.120620  ORF Transcript_37337/g.120620 Transcript_37337/m.120620 type:complete len:223 (+) Transcript_37337:2330-2998(+)